MQRWPSFLVLARIKYGFGGKEVKQQMASLIERERSVIVAADVAEIKTLEKLVKETCQVEGIGGFKVSSALVLNYGLPAVVSTIRKHTKLPIIYDHQKGGTDIPVMGKRFAKVCSSAGVDAVILFPFGGAETEISWLKACQEEGLTVLVGAHMTQSRFLASEGGFIADEAPEKIFRIAAENGVRDFVVPGNKPEYVDKYKRLLEGLVGEGSFVLYAPGFISQGGDINETGKVVGGKWHAIVGSAIYKSSDPKGAAEQITQQIK